MKPLAAFVNPAGGVSYHLRAARYGRTLWLPLRRRLANWLASWNPPEQHLLLVGPSAGYTLPMEWLARFEHLTLLEPDPLARWLFRRSFAKYEALTHFISEDHLIADPERFVTLTQALPDAAILFSNVLGQLRHLVPESQHVSQLSKVKYSIQRTLSGRSWASYHDRVSGRGRPAIPGVGLSSSHRFSDDEVAALYAGSAGPVTLFDHATDGLFAADLPHTYFDWELTPGYVHLLEAVCQVR